MEGTHSHLMQAAVLDSPGLLVKQGNLEKHLPDNPVVSDHFYQCQTLDLRLR